MMMPVKNALENTLNRGVVQRSCFILTGRSRYSSLFTLAKEDYQSWAGVKKSYATDPKYPEN
jgi:hypothetical protein